MNEPLTDATLRRLEGLEQSPIDRRDYMQRLRELMAGYDALPAQAQDQEPRP